MKIQPLFDRVIAIPIKETRQTASGITLGECEESEVKKARVVAVGTGVYESGVFIDMKINVNNIIYYEEHTVAKFFDGESEYILIKQTDILGYEKE